MKRKHLEPTASRLREAKSKPDFEEKGQSQPHQTRRAGLRYPGVATCHQMPIETGLDSMVIADILRASRKRLR